MDFYDVIIIGAGPGGLRAAEILGNSNLSVLVLEKNEEIGPKVCAGGITHKGMEFFPELKDQVARSWNTLKFNSLGKGGVSKPGDITQPFDIIHTMDRGDLGRWQLNRCQQFKNIQIRTNARASKIEKKHIVVNDQQIGYKYLVGADGSASLVKRYLKLPAKEKNMAFQYLVKPDEKYTDIQIFYDSKYFGAWYSWIFPHRDYVSIGTGCLPTVISSNEIKESFKKWIEEKGIDLTHAKYEAFSIDFDYHGFRFGNIFLVGDAAGLSSGLTGEGIYQAWISGDEVARLILNPNHNPKKLKEVIFYNKLHNYILKLLILFPQKLRDFTYKAIRKVIEYPLFTKIIVKIIL